LYCTIAGKQLTRGFLQGSVLSCLLSLKSDLAEEIKCTLIRSEDCTKHGGMTLADMLRDWAAIQKNLGKLGGQVGNSAGAYT